MSDRVARWLVHAIAQCRDCDFEEGDYMIAQKVGRDHFIKTGHTVTVESGYCQIYEKEDKDE